MHKPPAHVPTHTRNRGMGYTTHDRQRIRTAETLRWMLHSSASATKVFLHNPIGSSDKASMGELFPVDIILKQKQAGGVFCGADELTGLRRPLHTGCYTSS